MAEQQLFKTTLQAPDFVDIYNEALTSKVDELLSFCNVQKVKTIKQQSIARVVRETGLRRNKTKPYHLDQRRKSQSIYKEKGLLKGTKGTLEENLISGLDLYSRYENEQDKLFKKLSNRFPETSFLTNTEQQDDEEGFLNFIDAGVNNSEMHRAVQST